MEGMDNAQERVQENTPEQVEEGSTLQFFDSTEEAAASLTSEPQDRPEESEYVDPEAAPVSQEQPDSDQEEDYSNEEIEAAVLTFLSERLGERFRTLIPSHNRWRSTTAYLLFNDSLKTQAVRLKIGLRISPLTHPKWMT